jgi:hypothetical protein
MGALKGARFPLAADAPHAQGIEPRTLTLVPAGHTANSTHDQFTYSSRNL